MITDGVGDKVAFRVKARIVSEIGDELISSDDIAIYELIKNAYDAQATYARISLEVPGGVAETDAALAMAREDLGPLRRLLSGFVDVVALEALLNIDRETEGWVGKLRDAVLAEVRRHSTLVIDDNGEGMTKDRLVSGFMIIASTERLRREAKSGRAILGSKGVGRFSAKRLGRVLRVDTYAPGSPAVEHLRIDWSQYSSTSELFLDQVTNQVWSTEPAADQRSGTTLTISDLDRVWTIADIGKVAADHLAAFVNPFFPSSGFRILARFNNQPVELGGLQADLLGWARLKVEGSVNPDADHKMKLIFTPNDPDHPDLERTTIFADDLMVAKAGDVSAVGPFHFEFYDFLRNESSLVSQGLRPEMARFLDRWGGGGPMVFRDMFRVLPYGRPGYDWLEIDRTSTRGMSVRLRTLAMVGYVAIASRTNPGLIDQTNREGLRETDAFRDFRGLMKYAVELCNNQMREFWPPARPRTGRSAKIAQEGRDALDQLADEVVDIAGHLSESDPSTLDAPLIQVLADRAMSLRSAAHSYALIAGARSAAIPVQSYPALIELAGLGMAAEQLSHELLAALDRAEAVLTRLGSGTKTQESALLNQLQINFASLRRIAAFLMPLTQGSRRIKGTYDVVKEAQGIASHYQPIADRLVALRTVDGVAKVEVRINRGVLLQVFDNLIANSLYWLAAGRTTDPAITLASDGGCRVIYRDNGPGIEPRLRRSIFEPFVSTKPNGRGLGLFIARELLELQNCAIETLDPDADGRIRGFVIDFRRVLAK
jgi:hypothetical protein